MHALAYIFSGAFLCNGIPHLASGLCGEGFPTPFATPRGVGYSSPLLNFLWGFLNLLAGSALLVVWPFEVGENTECASFLAGFVIMGLYLSVHFGKVKTARRGKD